MDIKKCDRCGKCYENNELKFARDKAIFRLSGVTISIDVLGDEDYISKYEICNDCTKELIKFLEPIPKAETK